MRRHPNKVCTGQSPPSAVVVCQCLDLCKWFPVHSSALSVLCFLCLPLFLFPSIVPWLCEATISCDVVEPLEFMPYIYMCAVHLYNCLISGGDMLDMCSNQTRTWTPLFEGMQLFAYLATPTFPNTPALSQHCSCHITGKCVHATRSFVSHLDTFESMQLLTYLAKPTYTSSLGGYCCHITGKCVHATRILVSRCSLLTWPHPPSPNTPPMVGTACVTFIREVCAHHECPCFSPGHQFLSLRVHSPRLTWHHTHFSKQLVLGQRGSGGWVRGLCLMLHCHHPTSLCL